MAGSICILERDREILKLAFEHKILDLQGIYQLAFEGLHLETARRRVLKLCAYGYLEEIPFKRGRHLYNLFSLTEKGLSQIRDEYKSELICKTLRSYCVEHDLALFRIRQRLERLSTVKRYSTENMLQSLSGLKDSSEFGDFAKLNSDAACTIRKASTDFNVAIEFENSVQSKGRYESKFLDYLVSNNIDLVFYICARAQWVESLGNIELNLRGTGKHKIFFCDLEDVLKPNDELVFYNLSKAKVVLK